MKQFLGTAVVALSLAATATQPAAAQDAPPAAAILPPAGNVLAYSLLAEGDRVYVCEAGAGGQLGWVYRGPDAILNNRLGDQVGRLSSGPTWSTSDGSSMGGDMRQSMDAPRGRSTPWQLLQAASRSSSGIFSSVTYVQEVQTSGGLAPREPCTQSQSGQERRVEFTALYHFFIPGG